MSTLGVVLLVLAALLILVLAAPVRLRLDIEHVEAFTVRWRLHWVYGLVRVGSRDPATDPISPSDACRATEPPGNTSSSERAVEGEEPEPAVATPAQPKRRSRGGGRAALAVLRTPGLPARVVTFARSLVGRVRIESLSVHAAIGLSDPADTGIVYGLVAPALATARVHRIDVEWQPLFDEPGARLTVTTSVRVVPLAVAMTVLAFLLSPPVVRALIAARRARAT